jgi:hypothetical protein
MGRIMQGPSALYFSRAPAQLVDNLQICPALDGFKTKFVGLGTTHIINGKNPAADDVRRAGRVGRRDLDSRS